MNSFTTESPISHGQRIIRSNSCIIYPDDDKTSTGSVQIHIPTADSTVHSPGIPDLRSSPTDHLSYLSSKEKERTGESSNTHSPLDSDLDDEEGDTNEVYELSSAMQEYETIGVRSKQYGYVGSREALCSSKHMNENYEMALHYMNRYIIQDYQVSIPSVTIGIFYPNKEVSSTLSTQFMHIPTATLTNCLYFSLPNPTTISFNTIITQTSRNRCIVNIPTIVGRVLKGVDYHSSITQSNMVTLHLGEGDSQQGGTMSYTMQGNRFNEGKTSSVDDVRYLCIGELVCTARIAV